MSTLLTFSQRIVSSPYLGITILVFGLVVLFALFWNILLERKLSRLLGGNSTSLEDSLFKLHGHKSDVEKFRAELERYLETVEKRLNKNIQSVETVRFNPFKGQGSGGNQSFATTLINEKGDGVVISSLYSRDRVSVYAKPLHNFTSEFGLSDEEKESLEKASATLFRIKK